MGSGPESFVSQYCKHTRTCTHMRARAHTPLSLMALGPHVPTPSQPGALAEGTQGVAREPGGGQTALGVGWPERGLGAGGGGQPQSTGQASLLRFCVYTQTSERPLPRHLSWSGILSGPRGLEWNKPRPTVRRPLASRSTSVNLSLLTCKMGGRAPISTLRE